MPDVPKINWFQVMTDLKYHGYSLTRIEDQTGILAGTLKAYRAGREPGHHYGERLLTMWVRVVGKPSHDAPRLIATGTSTAIG